MTTWQGLSRSNCFAVKDVRAFAQWLSSIPGLRTEPSDSDRTGFLVWADAPDAVEPITDNEFVAEIFAQVGQGEVAVLVDAARETGGAVAGASLAFRAGHDNLVKLTLADLDDELVAA